MATPQDIICRDLSAAKTLIRTLQDQVTAVTAHVKNLTQKVRNGVYPTDKGLSFLEVKDQMLLMYMQDLTHIIMEKTSGKPLAENPGIMRLVETRTVLEKMRPIDQKLKYQIDKLVRAAVTGSIDENDPLRFKPNPQNLMSKLEESDREASDDGDVHVSGADKKSQNSYRKYVPPRLAPVHYDDTEVERERRILERAKKRALSSSVIRELKEQYTDAPEEIREGRAYHMMQQEKDDQHRTNYEESMMVRLNMTRKEKARKKRTLAMTSQLNSLTHFTDIGVLTGKKGAKDLIHAAKRSRKGPKMVKKKKGFRKRH